VAWSCFYGIDTGDRDELIAAQLGIEEICAYLNLDTLAYLSLDRLVEATGAAGAGFCDACFTGDYPVPVPVTLRKHVLEPHGGALDRQVVQPALDGTIA
jgi:amidophosphoribosyltransferase